MQLSNGLSDPVGLWLGHLLFDSMFAIVVASVIVIVFAAASNQFHGLGFFVRCFLLFLREVLGAYRMRIVGGAGPLRRRRRALLVLCVPDRRFAPGGIRSVGWIPGYHVCGMFSEFLRVYLAIKPFSRSCISPPTCLRSPTPRRPTQEQI